jgi:hypothetical protein
VIGVRFVCPASIQSVRSNKDIVPSPGSTYLVRPGFQVSRALVLRAKNIAYGVPAGTAFGAK